MERFISSSSKGQMNAPQQINDMVWKDYGLQRVFQWALEQ